ncbi:MAG: aquaporin family protein [Chitinophagaceae bacterium]|jgi:glycerol uptake facilitator protein|nr:aquaporin family protein [Chitinophagaceae bacterium]
MSPFSAELIGTALLILLGEGVVANVVLKKTIGNNSGWIVITTAWALAVYVGVVVAGPVSGAHLNPAVTIALAVAGKFEWSQVPVYIAAQFIGAMLGAALVWLHYKAHLDATADEPENQRAVFCTAPAIKNTALNFVSEVVGTFVLLYAVLHFTDANFTLLGNKMPIGMGSLGALPVALVVWVIGLGLGGTTGYAINPARDLAPRLMHTLLPMKGKIDSNWGYAWIPAIAPIVGGLLAALLYLING